MAKPVLGREVEKEKEEDDKKEKERKFELLSWQEMAEKKGGERV